MKALALLTEGYEESVSAANSTCSAAGRQVSPALHALPVPQLVADVMAEVVVPRAAHLVALGAVVVLIAAHPEGVVQPRAGAAELHRLPLLARVDHPLVDAASDQQLLICTQTTIRT